MRIKETQTLDTKTQVDPERKQVTHGIREKIVSALTATAFTFTVGGADLPPDNIQGRKKEDDEQAVISGI